MGRGAQFGPYQGGCWETTWEVREEVLMAWTRWWQWRWRDTEQKVYQSQWRTSWGRRRCQGQLLSFYNECSGLNGGPWKDMSTSWATERVNVSLFRKRVIADIIKLRILRWDHPGLAGWVLNPATSLLISGREEKTQTQRTCDVKGQRLEWCGHKEPPKPGRGKKGVSPRAFSRACVPADTLIWRLWANIFLLL